MENNVKEVFERINESSFTIHVCAESLEYIEKDLEELEIIVNQARNNHFLGLTNIVEQLVIIISTEACKIMDMSDRI